MIRRFILLLLIPSLCSAQSETEGLLPLSDRLQSIYATSRPDGFLVDPQRLLSGSEARERRDFLSYHASDSLIDLYVVLFKGDQMLLNPGDLSGYHLNSRTNAKPAVMIHYFMGYPERAKLHLTSDLQELVPLAEHGRALNSAMERAKTGVSPLNQLEKFMVQTSIQIYRMERLLREGTAEPKPWIPDALKETSSRNAERDSLMAAIGAFWAQWKFKLVGGVILLAGSWLLLRWLRQHATYEFPDSEVNERLGGAHGAGVGAVIEFGKKSKPPAAQLQKLKLH